MKMKYKVGYKVRVRSDLVAHNRYGSQLFVPNMKDMKGVVVTIKGVRTNYYTLEEFRWYWTDEMLESIKLERIVVEGATW